jgi:hypothetical protein
MKRDKHRRMERHFKGHHYVTCDHDDDGNHVIHSVVHGFVGLSVDEAQKIHDELEEVIEFVREEDGESADTGS